MPYFDEDDILEMQRREREEDERAYAFKARRDAQMMRGCPCECNSGGWCGGCGHGGCGGRR